MEASTREVGMGKVEGERSKRRSRKKKGRRKKRKRNRRRARQWRLKK